MNHNCKESSFARQRLLQIAIAALMVHAVTGIPSFASESTGNTDNSGDSPRQAYGQSAGKQVLWVDVKDFISSATSEHVATAIDRASGNPEEFSAVLVALDTPGGSVDATLRIIESIQASEVPVIGYVYPQGRSAWSAGTIILLGTDYAAMAPFTTIGSAQTVLGKMPMNDTKTINAITKKVVTLAELHNRNATQATHS